MDLSTAYVGPPALLDSETVAVLNSRQSKYPVGSDPWVQGSEAAVAYAAMHGWTVVSSLGMNTWELVLARAASRRLSAIVVVPASESPATEAIPAICKRFCLDPERTGFLPLAGQTVRRRDTAWAERDRTIATLAKRLAPVSIRPGGNLDRLIGEFRLRVIGDFRVPYEPPSRPRPRYDHLRANPAVATGLIVHFTRSRSSSWPGETDCDFYGAIVESKEEYCRSASQGLRRILDTGMIWGSSRNIRGGYAVVGFSEITGEVPLNRFAYRARLANPYFEPYGIGLDREAALQAGLRPVVYGSAADYERLTETDKPYFQSAGADAMRWRAEQEWRFCGNLRLDRLSPSAVRVLVPTEHEAATFRRLTPWRVDAIFTDSGDGIAGD
jgi:hypothetical protein